jgi:hypothetical protein
MTLAERWDGKRWALQAAPNPTQGAEDRLTGVSCGSARTCTAIGSTFAERWSDQRWTLQATLQPTPPVQLFLNGISCASARTCTAVGGSTTAPDVNGITLAERWQRRP